MPDSQTITLCVVIIIVLAIAADMWRKDRALRRMLAAPRLRPHIESFAPVNEVPLEVDSDGTAPIPVVVEDPPRSLFYRPRDGVAKVTCTCHQRLLEVGEEILWWPQPDGSVLVFCKDVSR